MPTVTLSPPDTQAWQGDLTQVAWDESSMQAQLMQLHQPLYVIRYQGKLGLTAQGASATQAPPDLAQSGLIPQAELLTLAPALPLQNLGDPSFLAHHGVQSAYMAGAMAGGIASAEMIIALGQAGLLGSLGTGGMSLAQVEAAIAQVQQALPQGPYCFNLLHNPHDPRLELATVQLYLDRGVQTLEASAFLDLTPSLVYYRVAGLRLNAANQIEIHNRILAKVSRQEVAVKFMRPAPVKLLQDLVAQGLITEQQAQLAAHVPMADDITVEADSGGHTDNRPLVCVLPAMIAIRDRLQAEQNYAQPVRIGAAGGIATPQSVLSAFMMGAAYVVTGSINQACLEAGTSEHTKALLAEAEMADVAMAPAADMFEAGVKVQVLKKKTLFPMRAKKLYELYSAYASFDDIPAAERTKLEKQILQQSVTSAWQEVADYQRQRNPAKLERALKDPKMQMAMVFRRYLGLSSRWARGGDAAIAPAEPGAVDRKLDYQIWCGPAMGAFNEWVKGSALEPATNRRVVDIAHQLLLGAAYNYRVQSLNLQGVRLPGPICFYRPQG